MERYCICCEKAIRFDGNYANNAGHLYDATIWTTNGNYGSTVFDPCSMSATHDTLEVIICDECLQKKAKFVQQYDVVKHSARDEVKNIRVFDPNG